MKPSRIVRAARRCVGSLCMLVLLGASAATASAQMVESLVVRYTDAATAASGALSTAQYSLLANALQQGFVDAGRSRDGAFRLQLTPALSIEDARAALNRARMLPDILYADVDASATVAGAIANANSTAKSGRAERPLHRLIIKYRDPAMTYRATQNIGLDRAALDTVAAAAGQPVAHERVMGGGAFLVRLLRPVPRVELEAIARKLEEDPQVEYAQADELRYPLLVPNDPQYANQWHYKSSAIEPGGANLPLAWDITTGSTSVFVAVLDTGILPHPDLAGRIAPGYDMIDDVLIANDGDLRDPDPIDSGDWVTSAEAAAGEYFEGCYVDDSSWHGTHVAGTIGAASNNNIGVAGINWKSKIVPVRVLGKCGGYLSDIIDGMRWAAGLPIGGLPLNANPARVVNLSLGGSGPCSIAEQNTINSVTATGTTVVIAAGNENKDSSTSSPGNCNGVITVSATGRAGQRASYSNFGNQIEIAAPGGGDGQYILSTLNAGTTTYNPTGFNYVYYQGTSMATPHVAGIVSLMLSVKPSLTPAQVLSLIQTTARAFPTNTARNCTKALCGAGIIDAFAAVASAAGLAASTTTLASAPNSANAGASVTFTATVAGTAPTGTVDFKDGATSISGCNAVPLTGSGNTMTAACATTALALGAHSVMANYSGNGTNQPSASAVLTQTIIAASPALPLYRFNTGASHFYTISESEKAYVIATFPSWKLEGIAYYAFLAPTPNTSPVYRFNTGSYHFYTISESEKTYVQTTFPSWVYEGIGFRTYATQVANTFPVYRFNTGTYHFYTISESEKAYVIATFPSWVYEGAAFYARKTP